MGKQHKYKAFISYSHQDQKFAKWLHREIENYKIPKSLREKYPDLPKDLKRSIFIDDEELPIAAALPDNLSHALESSEILIVVCSPSVTNSYWVDKEIAYFKQYHGEDRVLAILKDGEPNATYSTIYDNNLEAFPKSLRYKVDKSGELTEERTEPLAADARKRSTRKKALLKLIAGILKVDFADLWEREKRETRKRWAISGVLLSLFVAMGIYASVQYVGEQGNKELEHITAQIATIEYSIRHDELPMERVIALNKELKKLKQDKENKEASIEVLGKLKTSIGKKAQRVYDQKGAEAAIEVLTSKSALADQERRIKELSKEKLILAKLYVESYKFDEAEESFQNSMKHIFFDYENATEYSAFLYNQNKHQQALKLNEKLLQENLTYAQQAITFGKIAQLSNDLGDSKKSIELYTKALALFEVLAKNEPKLYNQWVAEAMWHLGSVYSNNSEYEKALKLLKNALLFYEKIKEYDEETYKEGATNIHNQLHKIYFMLGEIEKMKLHLTEAIKIQKSIGNNTSLESKAKLAVLLKNLGMSTSLNAKDSDFSSLFQALAIFREISKVNARAYLPGVSFTLSVIAKEYIYIQDFENAKKYYLEAELVDKKLYGLNPELFGARYIDTLVDIGDFYAKTSQYEQAKEVYIKALGVGKKLIAKSSDVYTGSVANILQELGNLYKETGQYEQAKNSYVEALENYTILNKKYKNKYKFQTAMTYTSLGTVYQESGDLNNALTAFTEELQIFKELNVEAPITHNTNVAHSYMRLGSIYTKIGKFKEAIEMYKKSIELLLLPTSSSASNKEAAALNFRSLSEIYIVSNDFDNSEESLNESLNIYRSLAQKNTVKYEINVADTLGSLGRFYLNRQKLDKAENAYLKALEIYKRHNNKNDSIAGVLSQLAAVYIYTNNIEKAKNIRLEILHIYDDLPDNEENSLRYASSLLLLYPISDTPQKDLDTVVKIFQKYKSNPVAADYLKKLTPYLEKNKSKQK